MRIYDFKSVTDYEMLYEGIMTTTTKGPDTRAVSRVLKELEKIGHRKMVKDKTGVMVESLLYTISECKPIEIQDSDHEVIKRLIGAVEWNGTGARVAGDMLTWFEDIPTKEDYERKKAALNDGVLKLPVSPTEKEG